MECKYSMRNNADRCRGWASPELYDLDTTNVLGTVCRRLEKLPGDDTDISGVTVGSDSRRISGMAEAEMPESPSLSWIALSRMSRILAYGIFISSGAFSSNGQ